MCSFSFPGFGLSGLLSVNMSSLLDGLMGETVATVATLGFRLHCGPDIS
jgi:hypothetical protein